MRRRVGVLASLLVVAAMFAGVSTAQAQTEVCVFEGVAVLDPGIQNISDDLGDPDPFDIEQGEYIFDGECAGTGVEIHSDGYYDNILCGSGFAHDLDGSGTAVGVLGGWGYEILFAGGVGALFIGPAGRDPLVNQLSGDLGIPDGDHQDVDPPEDDPDNADHVHGPVESGFTGHGAVWITPGDGSVPPSEDPDNCISSDDGTTDQFRVAGYFVAL